MTQRLKSARALLAGILTSIILSLGTDWALRAMRIFPVSDEAMTGGLFGLAASYRTAYGVLGSYIVAKLAPNRPMGHALVSGALGFAATVAGVVASWNHPEMGPHWYPLTLAATALPSAWAGAKLASK